MGVSLAISIIKAKRVSTRWRKEERQEVKLVLGLQLPCGKVQA